MYRLQLSRRDKKKLVRLRWLFVFVGIVVLALVIWLAWIRPVQRESRIGSFDECVAAGNPIQETYPEVCLTKGGKRFVNPAQDAAHQDAQIRQEELRPPTDPALLKLDVEEWKLRIPLTMETFDLTYAYVEHGVDEYLLFTYKRLIQLEVCRGDIGLRLSRSLLQRQPPFSAENPAPIAHAGDYYFYLTVAPGDKPCYDANNPQQAALVKSIAGDKTLVQATSDLLPKLIILPKQ